MDSKANRLGSNSEHILQSIRSSASNLIPLRVYFLLRLIFFYFGLYKLEQSYEGGVRSALSARIIQTLTFDMGFSDPRSE